MDGQYYGKHDEEFYCREEKVITFREKNDTIFGNTNLVNMNTTRHRHITRRPVGGYINYLLF